MADSTQFLIELAAKFTGGDAAVSTLATLGDRMLAAGASAVDYERTIEAMGTALDDASSALKSANDAVTLGEQAYKQAEIAADRAAKAVEKLAASGKSGDAFAKKQADAAEKAAAAAAALKSEAGALDAVKGKAAAAAAQEEAVAKGLKNVKGAAEQAAKAQAAAAGTGKVNEIAEALGKFGGPAGVAGQRIFGLATGFQKLRGAMGVAGPYIAIAVAIVAIATAAIAATVAIAKWAVGLADAGRTQTLLAAGVARSVEGGVELDATIRRLGDVVPQTREELLAMAGDLAKTGLRGKELTAALEKSAIEAAELKFGPDFAKQLLSLDVQSKRLSANLSDTFGGLKIEGLLGGMSKLVALFDTSTASGKALKFLFESLFQPIIDAVSAAIPKVERLFLYAEILALKAFIALKPYRNEIKLLAEGFLIAAAIVTGVLGVAIAVVFGSIAAMILGPIVLFGLFIAAVIAAGEAIYNGLGSAVDFVKELGPKMIQGLVDGITGGAAAVVDALTGVVKGGVTAVEKFLKIGSPSKLFEDLGGFTAEGFAGGVDAGAGEAQGALEAMVAPPAAGSPLTGGGGGGVVLQIENLNVNGANAKEQALDFLDQVTRLLEGDALALGGGEMPSNA